MPSVDQDHDQHAGIVRRPLAAKGGSLGVLTCTRMGVCLGVLGSSCSNAFVSCITCAHAFPDAQCHTEDSARSSPYIPVALHHCNLMYKDCCTSCIGSQSFTIRDLGVLHPQVGPKKQTLHQRRVCYA
jgi:hypothetical protein